MVLLRERSLRTALSFTVLSAVLALSSCGGGGTGNARDSGSEKTTLRVQASDADGDALQYQWRVTAGSIDNRNAPETIWTLPPGPGLHFAYVIVSDGKGGYSEQQYAVSSDALDIPVPTKTAHAFESPTFTGFDGGTGRLRFRHTGLTFAPEGGGAAVERYVYQPSVRVELRTAAGAVMFAGQSDEAGEVLLPPLAPDVPLRVFCATGASETLGDCQSSFTPRSTGARTQSIDLQLSLPAGNNLRLHGHVGLADGGVCGVRSEFASLQSTATVQLIDASGAALTQPIGVNRFGDYALDAPVLTNAQPRLRVRCESIEQDVPVPTAGGFNGQARELSVQLTNRRPTVVKMVANGPEGNVRGRMVVPESNVSSNGLPGPDQFLAFKGKDTKLGACLYYKSFGATDDCDAQGNLVRPISLDDWKRKHQLEPYRRNNPEVNATYINKLDLNLVRRMRGTQSGPDNIAFYVCNNPGPEGRSQGEIDDVIATGLAGEREVACVAMEWSVTPGVNGGLPFTKFLTFGPDGSLLLSVNLDGRGEKYLPGTCVACHGGTHYSGKFADRLGANPSPMLGSAFLTFDTGNYFFSSAQGLRKPDQQAAIKQLNELVRATERDFAQSPIRDLVDGWYRNNPNELDENYVPPAWRALEATRPGAERVYREIVGASCRTCHAAFKGFDWDAEPGRIVVPAGSNQRSLHVCGGSPDVAINASMPNALISRDRALEKVRSDPALAALMQSFFGCTEPVSDPAYARR
jgi:hypothetical protein